MRKEIYIRTQFIGFHRWENAPDEVGFLRNIHRHVFKIEVGFEVTHDDRDIEFFLAQHELNIFVQSLLLPLLRDNPSMSCEHLATTIMEKFKVNDISPRYAVVSEDGENGAKVYID